MDLGTLMVPVHTIPTVIYIEGIRTFGRKGSLTKFFYSISALSFGIHAEQSFYYEIDTPQIPFCLNNLIIQRKMKEKNWTSNDDIAGNGRP